MPVDVGSAVGEIKLDFRSVDAAVRSVQASLGKLSSGSQTHFKSVGAAAEQGFIKIRTSSAEANKAIDDVNKTIGRLGPAVFLAIGAAAAAGMGLVIKSAIETNSVLETTELQFETLMGSADEARDHVAGLFDFAKKTPFETGPIIEASKMMRTFGGDVLDTAANLTLIGDAAAATNAPIDELGFWVGRLYSNLQAGQPFGEAAMRLQELAVMSPKARQEMEALQKSGASAAEIFAVLQDDLGKFGGAMEKQAATWQGLSSTLKDQIQLLIADAMKPFFEEGKQGLEDLIALLNDPAITQGIMNLGKAFGEAAKEAAGFFEDVTAELAALGMDAENRDIMDQLGWDQTRQKVFIAQIKNQENTPLFGGGKEDLAFAKAMNAELEKMLRMAMLFRDDGPDSAWAAWAAGAAESVALADKALEEAWAADNKRIDEKMVRVGEAAAEVGHSSDWVARAAEMVRSAQNKARLETRAYVESLAAEQAALDATAKAAEETAAAFSAAFSSVQDDYTTPLRGEDKPLVTPARQVTTTTGGLSPEQHELLGTYREEVKKLEEDLFNLTNGIGTFGVEQEKVNEKIAEAQGEIAHYRALMAPLEGVTGQVSTSQQGLAVNVSAVHRAIYDQMVAIGAAPETIIAFAGATGIMSQAQMEAALQAAAVKIKIDELALKMAEGLPVEQALADLDAFITKITTGVDPAVQEMAQNAPTRIGEMRGRMLEEVEGIGADIPGGLAKGLADTNDQAVTAADDAATAVIDAARTAFGVESPSTVFMEIGGELTAGLTAGLDDTAGDVMSAIERIGDDAVGAWDDSIGRMPDVGQAIIDGVVRGLDANRDSLIGKMQEIARAAYVAAMAEIEAKSPSRVFMEMGAAIIDGIVAGIEGTEDRLYDKLASVADTMQGIGEGLFGMREDALQVNVSAADDALRAALADLQARYLISPEDVERLMAIDPTARINALQQLRLSPQFLGNASGTGYLNNAIGLAQQRNELEAEYIRQQEELKALEEARQKLDFLGYQMELLNLIADNGLDTSILEGLELGLDANMSDIIEAMTAAVGELITATEDELDIASPSKVFRDIGANIMRGMALGIADQKPLATVLKERLLDAQQLGLTLNPEQTVYIFGGYNPQMAQRGGGPRDALRDLYYQGL